MKLNLKALVASTVTVAALIAVPALSKLTTAEAVPPRATEALDLTAEQQSALDTLHENSRSQANSVLTAEQQTTLQASIEAGTSPRQALRELDLSERQRQELRSIRDDSRDAAQEILTEEQQQQLRQARANHRQTKGGEGRGSRFDELDLSEAQQSQIDAIRANTRSEVEAVLTAEQRSTLAATLGEDGNFRHALREVDLSEDQRTEIRSIMEGTRDEIGEVLTDDQKEQLQQAMQNRRGGRRR